MKNQAATLRIFARGGVDARPTLNSDTLKTFFSPSKFTSSADRQNAFQKAVETSCQRAEVIVQQDPKTKSSKAESLARTADLRHAFAAGAATAPTVPTDEPESPEPSQSLEQSLEQLMEDEGFLDQLGLEHESEAEETEGDTVAAAPTPTTGKGRGRGRGNTGKGKSKADNFSGGRAPRSKASNFKGSGKGERAPKAKSSSQAAPKRAQKKK